MQVRKKRDGYKKTVDGSFLQGQQRIELFQAAIKSQATLDPYEWKLIGFLKKKDGCKIFWRFCWICKKESCDCWKYNNRLSIIWEGKGWTLCRNQTPQWLCQNDDQFDLTRIAIYHYAIRIWRSLHLSAHIHRLSGIDQIDHAWPQWFRCDQFQRTPLLQVLEQCLAPT